jgi:hypothetical protein
MATAAEEADEPTGGENGTVSPAERRFEIVATVLLALAALATAWSGYQAALWDGIQSSDYTQASGLRTRAAQQHTEANQYRLADLSVFENFIDADVSGDTELADFYRDRFRDPLGPAYEAWIALDPRNNPDAPASPLGMDEYRLPQDAEAERLTEQADATFESGQEANATSDAYTATTLFFAAALFFAAISERFEYRRARTSLLVLGCVGLVAGLVFLIGEPITTG